MLSDTWDKWEATPGLKQIQFMLLCYYIVLLSTDKELS